MIWALWSPFAKIFLIRVTYCLSIRPINQNRAHLPTVQLYGCCNRKKYQPSGKGGTRSSPATLHRLQHRSACLIQNGRQGLEISQALNYWTSWTTLAKSVFLFNQPSMRTTQIQNGHLGAPKWPKGVLKRVYSKVFGHSKFLIRALLL